MHKPSLRARALRSATVFAPWLVAATTLLVACGDPRDEPRPEPRTPGGKTAAATATATTSTTAAASSSAKPTGVGEEAAKAVTETKLNDRERATLAAQLDLLPAPCADVPATLAQCIVEKRECRTCKPAAELVARLVRAAVPATDLAEFYKKRFDAANVKTIDIGKSPSKGPDDAAVTIVEWADFQCPACKELRPAFDLALERFPGQVRVVYKFYQITGHDRALEAAHAAQAAHNQGKFWEMHTKLFDNPEALQRTDLRKYAREIGLDLEKFKTDFDSEETKKTVAADIKQADDLGLEGTPTLYVNGRLFAMNPFSPEFEHWIALEIEQSGQTPAKPTERYEELRKELGLDKLGADPGTSPIDSAIPESSASAAPTSSASAGPSAGAPASAKPAKPTPAPLPPPKPTAPAPTVPAPKPTAPAPAPAPTAPAPKAPAPAPAPAPNSP